MFASCGKNNGPDEPSATLSVDLNPLTVNFPASGGSNSYIVKTNQPSWGCSSDKTWCKVEKDHNAQLLITTDSHISTTAPTPAKVTVTAGNAAPVVITVTQDAYVPPAPVSKAIYVVGDESIDGKSYAMLWKYQDGTVTRQQLSTTPYSRAFSVFVSGEDVYVGGIDYHGGTPDWGTGTVWKNGVATQQKLPDGAVNLGAVHSVRVIDNKVYAAGYYSAAFGASRACVWVDGVQNKELVNTNDKTQAKFIGQSTDGKIHVLGGYYETVSGIEKERIRYWVDGTLQSGYLPDNNIYPTGLWVEGNDVHIIGHAPSGGDPKNISYYWKNGVRQNLLYAANNTYSLYDIYIHDGDVYISGTGYNMWINSSTIKSTYPLYLTHFVVSDDGTCYSAVRDGSVPMLYVGTAPGIMRDMTPVVLTKEGANGNAYDIFIVE